MPILKAIAGHTSCQEVKRYLEKKNRALDRDFYNLSWDEREMDGYDPSVKDAVEWANEMDATRAHEGNDKPYEGRKARTYKHFIISPDPEDDIDLASLKELAGAWAMRFFGDFQVAIVYHDDNASNIPHAHLVVNNTNLRTGRRLHTDDPFELNRALQKMAKERDLHAFSNEMKASEGIERLAAGEKPRRKPRTTQDVYMGRAEREIVEEGGYSWISDIRGRVNVARTLARNESEFRQILSMVGIDVADSASSRRQDWVFSITDQPQHKVSAGKLGAAFSKDRLQQRFANKAAYRPSAESSRDMLRIVRNAIQLENLDELDRLSQALEVCNRYSIDSIAALDTCIIGMEARSERQGTRGRTQQSLIQLREARSFLSERNLLPAYSQRSAAHQRAQALQHGNQTTRSEEQTRTAREQQRGVRERSDER